MELAAAGVSDAEIGRRVGLNRSSVGRIRRKAEATPEPEPAAIDLPEAEPTPFPAPELPARERWPVNQFRGQTGVALDGAAARWLADWGRCYEADGLASELMAAIRSSAGPEVREPWAYLQQCIANRGDAWTVSPALLADVAIWGGTQALEYALTSIGGGYVTRPLAYLRVALRQGQARGRRHPNGPHNPVAWAVSLARRWAPELEIVGADAAVAAEAQAYQTRHLDSYRRRFGRLPWEPAEPDPPGDGENCCVGIGARGDDCLIPDLDSIAGESSPGPRDANATPAQPPVATSPVAAVQVQPEPEPETGAKREPAPSASKPPSPVATSPRRCPDPLGRRAPPGIPLADVADVACSEPGCGCLAYRRVGADPAPCPCHWTPTRRAYACGQCRWRHDGPGDVAALQGPASALPALRRLAAAGAVRRPAGKAVSELRPYSRRSGPAAHVGRSGSGPPAGSAVAAGEFERRRPAPPGRDDDGARVGRAAGVGAAEAQGQGSERTGTRAGGSAPGDGGRPTPAFRPGRAGRR